MEKVKLTKEEFIKRAMNGERFRWNSGEFFYDNSKHNPFRLDDEALKGCWDYLNGENEFEVVQPKPKTKIVKEYIYKTDNDYWKVCDRLMSESEAKSYFTRANFFYDTIYKSTDREFEVEDESI